METNLWNLIERDPYNPHFWTELVGVAENSKNYDAIVKAYSGFLERFPLMHVYRNKWALIVRQSNREGCVREAVRIFEESVSHGVLEASVDMWTCYCEFATKHGMDFSDDEVRAIFNRALSVVGSDYDSDGLWSLFIRWEEEKQRWDNVSALFCRVLSQPIRNLETFWKSFVEHAEHHSIERAATPQEKAEIDGVLNQEADNDVTLTADDLGRKMQQLVLSYRSKSYAEASQHVSERLLFELKISRTYFHFKAPGAVQIANWSEYLSSVEAMGDIERTIHLYERALIPMNVCPEIWIRYAAFLHDNGRPDEALALLERASKSPVWQLPEFHRLRGLFAEKVGDFELAQSVFDSLAKDRSGEAQAAVVGHILREGSRNGTMDDARSNAIQVCEAFLQTSLNPLDYALLSSILAKLSQTVDREILKTTCTSVPLALATLTKLAPDVEEASSTFQHFLLDEKSQLSPSDKARIFPVYLNFLRKSVDSIAQIRMVERARLATERQLRSASLRARREKAKDTSNPGDVMNRWIDYVELSDEIRRLT